MQENLEKLALPEISPATDEAIIAYLRHNYKIAEIAAKVEQEDLILKVCERLKITVLGYHVLRIEKWLGSELSEIREQILESLFQTIF